VTLLIITQYHAVTLEVTESDSVIAEELKYGNLKKLSIHKPMTLQCCNTVYLQHGGCNYCIHHDIYHPM